MKKGFSAIMPTYNQSSFIRRTIKSLFNQIYQEWKLIIINDGSTNETEEFIKDFLEDSRIVYLKNKENKGLGYAINQGFEMTRYEYIVYLLSVYYKNHLETIKKKYEEYDDLVLAYTGMRYESSDTMLSTSDYESNGLKKGYCLQLVQVSHKKTSERWVERDEWVTEDLFFIFWYKLTTSGNFGMTNEISCHWTTHSTQRYCFASEKYGGGLNKYRSYYQVNPPTK